MTYKFCIFSTILYSFRKVFIVVGVGAGGGVGDGSGGGGVEGGDTCGYMQEEGGAANSSPKLSMLSPEIAADGLQPSF